MPNKGEHLHVGQCAVCSCKVYYYAGFWIENLGDLFITLAFPEADTSTFGPTFGTIFATRIVENAAYIGFQLDAWFRFRIWIKGKFKKDQVCSLESIFLYILEHSTASILVIHLFTLLFGILGTPHKLQSSVPAVRLCNWLVWRLKMAALPRPDALSR